jgi:hypothetical protein
MHTATLIPCDGATVKAAAHKLAQTDGFMHGVYVYVGQVRVVIEALVAANEERRT